MPDASSPPSRLPVSIVTGFLGSGKTTLIAGLLRRPDMAGTAVLVNEFAALGIDDLILGSERRDGQEVVLLKNGCVCCQGADDLTRGILRLRQGMDGASAIQSRLLIETSGLADPVTLLHRLMNDLRLRFAIRLSGVVTVVDGIHGPDHFCARSVFLKQIAIADRRVITKDDLVPPERVEALAERLRAINPGAPVIVGQAAAQSDPDLLAGGLFDERRGEADAARWLNPAAYADTRPDHDETVRSWLVEDDRPVCWDRFIERTRRLVERETAGLLRLKGVVRTDAEGGPLVIHGVQTTFHRPVRLPSWPDGRRRTAIVVIGHASAAGLVDGLRAALADAASTRPDAAP